jgi:tetratricopeptide (TPR) repeat protein
MTELIRAATWNVQPTANAVFVHGLGGHPYDTWRREPNDGSFWPVWLAGDIPGLSAWTLSYPAPPTNWLGSAMPLQDRAINVLEKLLAEPWLAEAPLVFICHSLGGLIIKQMLREANDQQGRRPEVAALLARIKAVIFVATPHTGSAHASLLDTLRLVVWPSNSVNDLVKNDANLRNLNVWYRNWSATQKISHLIFYETQGTAAGVIVDPGSGDAGLAAVTPIPIDANHISICKPFDKNTLLYQRTLAAIADLLKEPAPKKKTKAAVLPALQVLDLPAIRHSASRPWGPILLRLAMLAFLAFIGFKGVEATFFPGDPLSQATVEEITSALQRKDPLPSPEEIERYIGSLRALAGEPTFEQAVAESKRGNTRIAEGIWEQIYEKRKKDQESAKKEQAEAARNLGASVAIASAAKSLSWYREATVLDPDNLKGWRGLGDAALKAGTIEEAERAKRRYLALAREENSELDVLAADIELGDVMTAENNLTQAFDLYTEALGLARKLRAASPGDMERARNVSVCLDGIGGVLSAQGDLEGALKLFRESLEIRRKRYDEDKNNEVRAHDVLVSLEQIGGVLQAQGDLVGALKNYREDLEISRILSARDNSRAEWARAVLVSVNKIGNVLSLQGDVEGALKHYREALDISNTLYEQNTSDAGRARDVSLGLDHIGGMLLALGDQVGALKHFRKGLEISRKLYEQDRSHAEWARDVTVSLDRIGDLLRAQGDIEGALKLYREGLVISRKLQAQDKTYLEWACDVAIITKKIGNMLWSQGDLMGALKHYREGVEIARRLVFKPKIMLSGRGLCR